MELQEFGLLPGGEGWLGITISRDSAHFDYQFVKPLVCGKDV